MILVKVFDSETPAETCLGLENYWQESGNKKYSVHRKK